MDLFATPDLHTPGFLNRVAHVLIVAADRDTGALIMVRCAGNGHDYWTYPQARRGHPRIPLPVTAAAVIRDDLALTSTDLTLIDIRPQQSGTGLVAVYATLTSPPPSAGRRQPRVAVTAMPVDREAVRALDFRPPAISEQIARAGATPIEAIRALIAARIPIGAASRLR